MISCSVFILMKTLEYIADESGKEIADMLNTLLMKILDYEAVKSGKEIADDTVFKQTTYYNQRRKAHS